jgi:RecA/RadA recombinase
MIIELFGPPGTGKTTFARALANRLQERGHLTELRLSYRPTEYLRPLDPRPAIAERSQHVVMPRLRRPLAEVLTIARHPFANARDVEITAQLLRLLPPKGIFSSIKHGQYLLRLSHSWHERISDTHVVLFDQGFIQAVCSLALRAEVVDDALIADALDYAPKSDLLVRLVAPQELVRARLHDRRSLQGTIERLFEPDLATSLASAPMIDRLHSLLLQQGRSVLSAASLDASSLEKSVSVIEEEVARRLRKRVRNDPVSEGQGLSGVLRRKPA